MVYETKFTNHSSEEVKFQRGQETSQTFDVKPGQTVSIQTADPIEETKPSRRFPGQLEVIRQQKGISTLLGVRE